MPHGLRQGCQHSILALAAVRAESAVRAFPGVVLGPVCGPVPPLRPPLQLPQNCVDRTAERVGTVVVIVGAPAAPKDKPK